MQLEVGRHYIWNGKAAKLTARWAQGSHFTYVFEDGRKFNGDPKPMFASGELKNAELPPAVKVDPIADPDWKRAKAIPTIVPTPEFLKKDDRGKTSKS